jgi:hypothetical protein
MVIGNIDLQELFALDRDETISHDQIEFKNYPFAESKASVDKVIKASEILEINLIASPPVIRIANELIFVSANKKDKLKQFAANNEIPVIKRYNIWNLILAPYLDLQLEDSKMAEIMTKLKDFGLDEETVDTIREEVKDQMIRYNYDAFLWEKNYFCLMDALLAMRNSGSNEYFKNFYWKSIQIGLLAYK